MAMSPAAKPGDGGARSMTVEELSEELGWSWYQWRLFLFVGLCVAADSIEVNLLSFISVEATKDWHLEEFWEDTVAAAVADVRADEAKKRRAAVLEAIATTQREILKGTAASASAVRLTPPSTPQGESFAQLGGSTAATGAE